MNNKLAPILIESNKENIAIFSPKDTIVKNLHRYQVRVSNSNNIRFICDNIITLPQQAVGSIGLTKTAFQKLELETHKPEDVKYTLELREIPESYAFIKNRLKKKHYTLNKQEIDVIVNDKFESK